MNKSQFIEFIAKEMNLTKADAKRNLESFLESRTELILEGKSVKFENLGSFEIYIETKAQPKATEITIIKISSIEDPIIFKPSDDWPE